MPASETVFKLAFAATLILVVASVVHAGRRASQRHGSRLDQARNDLPWLLWVRALLAIPIYAGLADWLLGASWFPWAYSGLPAWARWAGVVLAVAVVALFWWIHLTLGANYHGTLGLHDDHRLVTGGPYRLVRHPSYVAFPLLMAAVWLLSASWLIGVPGLALVILISLGRAPVEEAQLADRFGDAYRRYVDGTPRFLPRLLPWSGGGGPSPGGDTSG